MRKLFVKLNLLQTWSLEPKQTSATAATLCCTLATVMTEQTTQNRRSSRRLDSAQIDPNFTLLPPDISGRTRPHTEYCDQLSSLGITASNIENVIDLLEGQAGPRNEWLQTPYCTSAADRRLKNHLTADASNELRTCINNLLSQRKLTRPQITAAASIRQYIGLGYSAIVNTAGELLVPCYW